MGDEEERAIGPFSFLGKKHRKKNSRQHSKRLRDILGESANDGNESDSSRYSEMSGNKGELINDESNRRVSVVSSVSNSSAISYSHCAVANKHDDSAAKDVHDIQPTQSHHQAIVTEECTRISELTKGMRSMNKVMNQEKETTINDCQVGQALDAPEKLEEGETERSEIDTKSSSESSQSLANSGCSEDHQHECRVRRKHNMFHHELEDTGADSGLDEIQATSQRASQNQSIMDHNGNAPSNDKLPTRDGLLSRFGERQSSGKIRKRHFSSNASDFERKMNSPISSRSSSMRSSYSSSVPASIDSGLRMGFQEPHASVVIVAIDFGTTYSGYAFAFTRDPESIHMMRKWEGGDPGVNNQKTPTTLLLRPDGSFHSFGFGARDFYHDLDPAEAKQWLYFEKFKMSLHSSEVCYSIFILCFFVLSTYAASISNWAKRKIF